MRVNRGTAPPWLLCFVLSAIALFMIVGLVGSLRRVRPSDGASYDDDGYWFLGFYNNPDDPSLLAASRILRRQTINIGHPAGLIFMLGVLVMIVGLDVLVAVFASR